MHGDGRLEGASVGHSTILGEDIRKGPPLVGRFEKLTLKETPTPLGLAVAEMEPLMLPRGSSGLKNSLVGRVAS